MKQNSTDSECPDWTKLTSRKWVDLLIRQPQLADKCDFTKFDGSDWLLLLLKQPGFAERCNWDKLDERPNAYALTAITGRRSSPFWGPKPTCWSFLLSRCPQYAKYRNWDKVYGDNWREFKRLYPNAFDDANRIGLDGNNWVDVLIAHPEFANLCEWSKLDGLDWVVLLESRPEYASYCEWMKINEPNIYGMQSRGSSRSPRPRSRYGYSALSSIWSLGEDAIRSKLWLRLLKKQPQFVDKCDWDKIQSFWSWSELLTAQPQFAYRCDWKSIRDPNDWLSLLIAQPQFAEKCNWNCFSGSHWARLLGRWPQFAKFCDWDKLYSSVSFDSQTGYDTEIVPADYSDNYESFPDEWLTSCWAILLKSQPRFREKCVWDRFDGRQWALLLRDLPQYAEHCNWEKLYEQAIVKVEFDGGCCGEYEDCGNQADCRRGYYEEPFHCWCVLLQSQPQFADRCDWARLSMTDMEWTRLLSSRPQLANYLTGEAWTLVITKNPDMANSSNLVKLSGKDWAVLLARRPEFADKCPYEKLSFPEIVRLFASAPQTIKPYFDVDECLSQAKESDWDALSCDEWIQLLEEHPTYADKCDFERFSGEETMRFLLSMPQFAKHCCIGKLYEEIGEGDNRHVCFAELLVKGTKNAFGGKRFHPYARLSEIKSLCDWARLSCQDLKWIMRRALDFEYTYVAYTTRLFKPQGSLLNRSRNAPRISRAREIRIVKNANLDWYDLSGLDIVKLLKTFPQLSGQCNLSLLTVEDWVDLLEIQPTLAEKCKHLEKQIADERLCRDERLRRDEEELRIREEARKERRERLFETECDDPEYAEMEYWNTH